MADRTPVIVSAKRTPFGRFMGGLSNVKATDLGTMALQAVFNDIPAIRDHVDEAIFGCVLQAGLGQNPARQVGLNAGLPDTLPAFTVNKVCGSSMKAAMLACQAIKAGDADTFVVGGIESMSRAPHLASIRAGFKFGPFAMTDHMQYDGLHCPFCDWAMGNGADWIANEFGISREAQDRYAVQSHQRATQATRQGWFAHTMVPVPAEAAKQKQDVVQDEGVRPDSNTDALAKLRPAFDQSGTVTAGNASQISDGASAMAITTMDNAEQLGLTPIAKVVAYHTHGVPPKEIFTAPVGGIKGVLDKAGANLQDIDLFEINEAFAAQTLANIKALELPEEKVNVAGGAIAIGHPIGVSGTRILGCLVYQMKRLDLKRGIAAACLGGGNSVAMLVERV